MIYSFGKILKCNSEHFIFLSDGEECYYLAVILDKGLTDRLELYAAKSCSTDKTKRSLDLNAFHYIILTRTKEFKDRAAHYNNNRSSQTSLENYNETNIDVDLEDLKELKKEILDNHGVPLELKERLQKISI